MNLLHAQLPAIRSGQEYLTSYAALLARATEASKTDNDTDYREVFVSTKTEDGAPLKADLSRGSISTSSNQWDDYDNVRVNTLSMHAEDGKLMAVEHSIVDADNCDYENPWTRLEGTARTITVDMATGQILGQVNSSYDRASDLWS